MDDTDLYDYLLNLEKEIIPLYKTYNNSKNKKIKKMSFNQIDSKIKHFNYLIEKELVDLNLIFSRGENSMSNAEEFDELLSFSNFPSTIKRMKLNINI